MPGGISGFVAKTIAYPFDIPAKMDISSTNVGLAANGAVNGINAAIGSAYMGLQPKGPAKWLVPLFQKINDATVKSDHIATRNKTVFWDPLSDGADGIGAAVAGPFAYHALKKMGNENPTAGDVYKLLYKHDPLVKPAGGGDGGGGGGGAGDGGGAGAAAGAAGGAPQGGANDAAAAAAAAENAAQAAQQAAGAGGGGGEGGA